MNKQKALNTPRELAVDVIVALVLRYPVRWGAAVVVVESVVRRSGGARDLDDLAV